MRLHRMLPAFLMVGAISACADSIPGPGTMTVTLETPFGRDGAALISVFGDGIIGVTPITGRVYGARDADSFVVVVVAEPSARLAFGLQVMDTLALFEAHVLQVAAPDDILQTVLGAYSVDIRR